MTVLFLLKVWDPREGLTLQHQEWIWVLTSYFFSNSSAYIPQGISDWQFIQGTQLCTMPSHTFPPLIFLPPREREDFFFNSSIHMCIHCLGHLSPCPQPPPSPGREKTSSAEHLLPLHFSSVPLWTPKEFLSRNFLKQRLFCTSNEFWNQFLR
jgi:hypothetical protein